MANKLYSIHTPHTTYMVSSKEEALILSKKYCAPIMEFYPNAMANSDETPMRKKIREAFGEVNKDTIHKYIISHPDEAGILFTKEAYSSHISMKASE